MARALRNTGARSKKNSEGQSPLRFWLGLLTCLTTIEREGLVKRWSPPADSRSSRLALTARGRKKFSGMAMVVVSALMGNRAKVETKTTAVVPFTA